MFSSGRSPFAGMLALLAGLVLSACTGAGSISAAIATPVDLGPTETAVAAHPPARPELILATTTSTQDSGLLDVLVPDFERRTGYQVKTVAVGSGQALKMGEQGNADVLLVHSPAAEQAFMQAGSGVDRRLVMHNDFVIVGPQADPGNIRGRKAVAAFKAIADVSAPFVSRGDNSGTNALELQLWKTAAIKPQSQPWYIVSGQGMGATLNIANEKNAYTLSDRATFLAYSSHSSLDVLVEHDPVLLNIYHVIRVNPAKWPGVNAAGAQAFADYLVDLATQQVIAGFGLDKYHQALFVPDAGKSEGSVAP